jgi:hypothetical protein
MARESSQPLPPVKAETGIDVAAARRRAALTAPLAILALTAVLWSTLTMSHSVDTWWSLAAGRHIAAHGVGTVDPFSFASRSASGSFLLPDGWVNQSWLTHSLLLSLMSRGGMTALVLFKLVNYLLVLAALLLAARAAGALPEIALALAAAALFAGGAFYEVRAQDVTNLLAAVLVLVLATAARGRRAWAWAAVPLVVLWCNAHGGFVWGLFALWTFAAADLVAGWRSGGKAAVRSSLRATWAPVALAATVATVVASPYRLTNLLHPLVITAGPASAEWRTVAEWQPLTTLLIEQWASFAIAAASAGAAWLAARRRRSVVHADEPLSAGMLDGAGALLLLVTVAMAVVSRRFVPFAYLLAVPLTARWLTAALPAPRTVERRGPAWRLAAAVVCWLLAVAAVVTLAVRFNRIYLGPWPVTATDASFAERNLQTFRQPWDACMFMRTAGLHGRLFSFWENTGFWEWCQQPDAATGRVPMQLLIDPRAQQAFDIETFRTYRDLVGGGPAAAAAAKAGRPLGDGELAAARIHVAARLKELGVLLVHVSPEGLESALGRVIFSLPGWEPVYVDPHHALVIDSGSEQGRALVAAVDAASAAFPTEAAAALTRSFRLLRLFRPEPTVQAFALARRAYELQPSARAVDYIATSTQYPPLRAQVVRYCADIVADLASSRDRHAQAPGYFQRVMAATAATQLLVDAATATGDFRRQGWAKEQYQFLAEELAAAEAAADW